MSSSKFRDRVSQLEEATARVSDRVAAKERCLPKKAVFGFILPFLLGFFLWLIKPKWVMKKEGGRYIRDYKRLVMWTLAGSALGWAGLYLWSYYRGHRGGKVCMY